MNKKNLGFISCIVIIIIAGIILEQKVFVKKTNHSQSQTNEKMHISEESEGEEQGEYVDVIEIRGGGFEPKVFTMPIGHTLAFHNGDTKEHDIKSDKELFRTDPIEPNDSINVIKFTKPGIYTFHCILHPEEKGTIIVKK